MAWVSTYRRTGLWVPSAVCRLSCAQGYDAACSEQGRATQNGLGGLAININEAVRLFTLASARGQMYGLNLLGYAHDIGLGLLAESEPKVRRPEPFNFTPMGGHFDFAWPSARTMHPHGAYVW